MNVYKINVLKMVFMPEIRNLVGSTCSNELTFPFPLLK